MTNLNSLVVDNKDKYPLRMNIALKRFGMDHGLQLAVGYNDPFDIAPESEQVQAIEVNQQFIETLQLLGATMKPTLAELDEMCEQADDPYFDSTVEIHCDNKSYKGEVYLGILSKCLTLWMDTTKWEDIS